MQIEAIYQNGRLEFPRPIHFKAGPVRLLIEMSPDALEETAATSNPEPAMQAEMAPSGASLPAEASQWLTRLETLRAEAIAAQRERPETLDDEQLERLDAFEMREDR